MRLLPILSLLLLSSGCAKKAGLLNFGLERSTEEHSTVEMKDIVAEVVAAEMQSVTTEIKEFTAETVATTTQTIYGDAKWVVISTLGLAAMAGLVWIAERALSLRFKVTQARQLRQIANGGTRPPDMRARNPPDDGVP